MPLLAAAGMGALMMGCPAGLNAQDMPADATANQQPQGFPLGIDPNEKDFNKLRDAIKETMTAALPPGATVERVLVSNDYFDPELRKYHHGLGVRPNLFARIFLNKDGQKYVTIELYVTGNEKEAEILTRSGDFPYVQRIGNIALQYTQYNSKEYDNEFLTAIAKGLGIPPENTLIKVLDGPLGIDLNESERNELSRSIMKRVGQALPRGMEVIQILLATEGTGIRAEQRSKQLGVTLRFYAQLAFKKGKDSYIGLEILKVGDEKQVEKIYDQYVFPYAQRVGDFVVIFAQKDDASDYDEVIEIAQKLGLSRQLK